MGTALISRAHITGKKHRYCEDKSAYRRTKKYDIVVLCDGAGSAKHAKEGARIIAQYVATRLPAMAEKLLKEKGAKSLYGELPEILVRSIRHTLEHKSGSEAVSSYAATLLFALYSHTHKRWLFGHIGDGVIGGITQNGELVTLSTPCNGEHANETYFVTGREAAKKLRIFTRKNLNGAILMSDGSAHTFFSKSHRALAPGIKKLFSWQQTIKPIEMNAVLRKNLSLTAAKRTTDDCSVIMIQHFKKEA
jgi:hypothetical protein